MKAKRKKQKNTISEIYIIANEIVDLLRERKTTPEIAVAAVCYTAAIMREKLSKIYGSNEKAEFATLAALMGVTLGTEKK